MKSTVKQGGKKDDFIAKSIVIGGNLTVRRNELKAGHIFVMRNINVEGDVICKSGLRCGGDFYANGNVDVDDDIFCDGDIYAGKNLKGRNIVGKEIESNRGGSVQGGESFQASEPFVRRIISNSATILGRWVKVKQKRFLKGEAEKIFNM